MYSWTVQLERSLELPHRSVSCSCVSVSLCPRLSSYADPTASVLLAIVVRFSVRAVTSRLGHVLVCWGRSEERRLDRVDAEPSMRDASSPTAVVIIDWADDPSNVIPSAKSTNL